MKAANAGEEIDEAKPGERCFHAATKPLKSREFADSGTNVSEVRPRLPSMGLAEIIWNVMVFGVLAWFAYVLFKLVFPDREWPKGTTFGKGDADSWADVAFPNRHKASKYEPWADVPFSKRAQASKPEPEGQGKPEA